ncbi:MAG: RNA polymerase factor sigma-54 [Terrimicrobiaceae bacterium]
MAGLEQYQGLAQQQTLSPQMQQSLHILQAPVTELRQLVSAELAENPVLEEVPREERPEEAPERAATEANTLGDEWREYYAQRSTAEPWTAEALERRQHFLDSQTRGPTLHEFMSEQLEFERFDARKEASARVIIGNLDDAGYFRGKIEEAAYPVGCTVLEAEEVLERVQQFDPPGVAARNLVECLLIQLKRQDHPNSLEIRILQNHIEDLARRKIAEIARALKVSPAEIQRAAENIKKLDPRPGSAFAADDNQVINPDVVVFEEGGEFHVVLNDEDLPKLRVADDYKDMVGLGSEGRNVREFLREKIRGGRFFIKCLQQRQQTILAISREILTRQKAFFENGAAHLRPMTMSQVAEAVGVHETTVSRAVSGKFMATPHGVFELKYFFTSGYVTEDGQSMSNESVRQAILDLVKGENPKKPLSDQGLAEALAGQGIPIARRTIAKYREQLGILPSNMRRGF